MDLHPSVMPYAAVFLVFFIAAGCQPPPETKTGSSSLEATEQSNNSAASLSTNWQKVVYHINYDNPHKQAAALKSMRNHLNAAGPKNIDMRVVLHGSGLSLLLESDSLADTGLSRANASPVIQAQVSQLKDDNVVFYICKNSLDSHQINYRQDLYDVAKTDLVSNGVTKIIELQSDGFMYLKP